MSIIMTHAFVVIDKERQGEMIAVTETAQILVFATREQAQQQADQMMQECEGMTFIVVPADVFAQVPDA